MTRRQSARYTLDEVSEAYRLMADGKCGKWQLYLMKKSGKKDRYMTILPARG